MSTLVRTGIAGLDEVLLGGLKRGNNILIEGAPGAGKTTLGLQFIHSGAALYGEPGVIVSFELEPEKLLRDASGFNLELQSLIDEGRIKIIQTTPSVLLSEFRNHDGVFTAELQALGARRLLIDGLTPLKLYAQSNDLPYREDIHLLVEGLTRLGVTTAVTSELSEPAMPADAHERFVFDTIITLERAEARRRVHRTLAVVKSRGQDFISGNHTMRIDAGVGVSVYRRAQSRPKAGENQPVSDERLTTGSPSIDRLMGGGPFAGSVTMVAGISGTGKTVLAHQFLLASCAAGRKGLFVTLDEHPRQLIRNARTLGLDLGAAIDAGQLFIHYESPLELELDYHFDRVAQLVADEGIDCVVFDSVAVYEMSEPEQAADFLYALADYFKQRLITVFFNYESPELLGVSQISESLKGSHLVDNIVLLSYVEISTQLRRALTVPKVRGSRNVQSTREYVIGAGGIALIEDESDGTTAPEPVPQLPFSAYYGLLSRSPARHSPAIDEAVMQGKALPDSQDPPGSAR